MSIKRILWLCLLLSAICICGALGEHTLLLPEKVTVIEEEAFYGDAALDVVVLPEGVLEIGSRAFVNSGLKSIHLPASLTSIADDAFDSPEKVTVTAEEGTYAYDWAVAHGYIDSDGLILSVTPSHEWLKPAKSLTWTVVGSEASLDYAYTVYQDGIEVYSKDYSRQSRLSYTPRQAGIYTVRVTARDAKGLRDTFTGAQVRVINVTGISDDALMEIVHSDFVRVVSPWTDSEGYTEAEDVPAASEAFYAMAQDLKQQGFIRNCTYSQNSHSIALYPRDGGCFLFCLPIRNAFDGSGNTFGVMTMQSVNSTEHAIDVMLSPSYTVLGSKACADHVLTELPEYYTTRQDLDHTNATVDSVKSCIQSLAANHIRAIFWYGHGTTFVDDNGTANTESDDKEYAVFSIPEAVIPNAYATDRENRYVLCMNVPSKFGNSYVLTSKFFDAYLPEVNGGMFFTTACCSNADGGNTCNVFINHGFDVYAGTSATMIRAYGIKYMGTMIEYMCKENGDSLIDYDTAFQMAQNKCGENDLNERILLGYGGAAAYFSGSSKKNPYNKKSFRLIPEYKRLRFNVWDSEGNRIENAQALMQRQPDVYSKKSATYIETLREEGGKQIDTIEIPEMDWGPYAITVAADHFRAETDTESVVEKGEVPKNYTLKLLGECTGVVTDQDTDKPLSGTTVTATCRRNGETYSMVTDKNGSYSFSTLDCGTWDITFVHQGYSEGRAAITLSARNWQTTASSSLKRQRLDLFPYLLTPMEETAKALGLRKWTPDDPDIGGWETTYENDCFSVTVSSDSSWINPTPIEDITLTSDPDGMYCIDGFCLGMTQSQVATAIAGTGWKQSNSFSQLNTYTVVYERGAYSLVFRYQNSIAAIIEAYYRPWDA